MKPRRGDDATGFDSSGKASSSPRRALQAIRPAPAARRGVALEDVAQSQSVLRERAGRPARAARSEAARQDAARVRPARPDLSQPQQALGQETPQEAQPNQPAPSLPTSIAARLRRFFKSRPIQVLWRVIQALIVVSATGILVATFFISVLQVRGTSMEPTVKEGDVVIADHSKKFATGDVIAFYYNNKVILKRVIAFPTDWVDIKPDGTVWVNGEELQEDYVQGLSLGHPDIIFPYQVPEGRYFVLGDHRSASIDSRSSTIGTVSDDQVIGSVFLKVWPLKNLGTVR